MKEVLLMAFEPKTFFDLVTDGLNYLKANTNSITSLYQGGRARTLIEVNALLLAELYLYVNDKMKEAASEGLYTALDFPPLPAMPAKTTLTFTGTAGTVIPAGTIVQTVAGIYTPPIQFTTDTDAQIPTGSTTVNVSATAVIPQAAGNVAANTLTVLVTPIQGIQSVTNPNAASGGMDAETEQERALRFANYIQSLSQGSVASINYAAQQIIGVDKTAVVEPPLLTCQTSSGNTYTDQSTEANMPWGIPFSAFSTSPVVGDSLYVGAGVMFNNVYINFAVPGSGITGTWQYWNGTTWANLSVTDNTSNLTKSGSITFTVPSDWQATAVNNQLAFYIRYSLTSASITTIPQIYHIVALNPPPGWINVVIYSSQGVTNNLLQQVASAVSLVRGAGIQANVIAANTKQVNINAAVLVPPAYNNPATQQNIVDIIQTYINGLNIGQSLYLSQLTQAILGVNAGSVVTNVSYSSPTSDVIVPADTLIIPGTITITLQSGS